MSPPRRILINGASGAGKTTLAAAVAERTGIPHTELDALHHGPNWVPRPTFPADVAALAASPAWVTEWQYGAVRELLSSRAELVVWLDLPFRVIATRLLRRTLDRRFRRTVLWNGNIEPPLWTVLTDRKHVLRLLARSYRRAGDRAQALAATVGAPPVVRLRTAREVESWLAQLTPDRQNRGL